MDSPVLANAISALLLGAGGLIGVLGITPESVKDWTPATGVLGAAITIVVALVKLFRKYQVEVTDTYLSQRNEAYIERDAAYDELVALRRQRDYWRTKYIILANKHGVDITKDVEDLDNP